jgi:leucyl aminopeptidase (aminopeptidase T)
MPMSRVPWHLIQNRQPRTHLVVCAIVRSNGPAGLNDSTEALAVVRRLAKTQRPAGEYAVTVVRDAGSPEVYVAFNDQPIASYPGWASQRAFEMDVAKIRELAARFHLQRNQNDRHPMRNAYWIALYADPGP